MFERWAKVSCVKRDKVLPLGAQGFRSVVGARTFEKTNLQPPGLMMQIVEPGSVVVNIAERIQREDVAAMIADSLDGCK